jgi:hypothetical protein
MSLELNEPIHTKCQKGVDFLVTDFEAETVDGLYRFVFSGEIPFQCIISMLNQVERLLSTPEHRVNFKQVEESERSSLAEVISVKPEVLLYSFVFRNPEHLMKLLGLSRSDQAYH